MKKIIPVVALLAACFCQIPVFAASGSIEIEVPEKAGNITVCYTKIAEWEETAQDEFDGLPKDNVEYENQAEFEVGEIVRLTNLEEGIYQVQVQGNEEYEFSTAVVSVPMWNEEEQQMEYDIQMIPKYIRNIPEPEPTPEPETKVPAEASPQTGDYGKVGIYGIFGMFSLLIVIMSCHNRFKCARMSE